MGSAGPALRPCGPSSGAGACRAANKIIRVPARASNHMGKRLIDAMKQVVDHVERRTALPMRYVEVPEDVDVRAIRSKLGLSQAEFSRRYGVSPRSLQEWEQGRRRPESAVRAYLTVIDRNPEAVEKALMNNS